MSETSHELRCFLIIIIAGNWFTGVLRICNEAVSPMHAVSDDKNLKYNNYKH